MDQFGIRAFCPILRTVGCFFMSLPSRSRSAAQYIETLRSEVARVTLRGSSAPEVEVKDSWNGISRE